MRALSFEICLPHTSHPQSGNGQLLYVDHSVKASTHVGLRAAMRLVMQ